MITGTHPDDNHCNELKELQDAMMKAMRLYEEACREYGGDPTPEKLGIAVEYGRRAEVLAAEYDRLTGKYTDELPY